MEREGGWEQGRDAGRKGERERVREIICGKKSEKGEKREQRDGDKGE